MEGEEVREEAGTPQADPQVEQEALGMGWIPKEQFKGDPSRWRPADEFVKRGRELMPILKATNRKLEEKIYNLEKEVQTSRSTTEKLLKMAETVSKDQYERAKTEIIKQQTEAITAGDGERWRQLEEKKESLQKPEEIKPEPSQANPEFETWHSQNDWYMKDEDLNMYANALGQRLTKTNPNMAYGEWLKKIEEGVKAAFPHKFSNPARNMPSAVDAGTQRGSTQVKTGKKTYSDLPADAKAQCDKYVAQGLMTKEKYVQEYPWD